MKMNLTFLAAPEDIRRFHSNELPFLRFDRDQNSHTHYRQLKQFNVGEDCPVFDGLLAFFHVPLLVDLLLPLLGLTAVMPVLLSIGVAVCIMLRTLKLLDFAMLMTFFSVLSSFSKFIGYFSFYTLLNVLSYSIF
jgi:hypothetical protein